MIETTTVSGRPAQVAYLGAFGDATVTPDAAVLIKVLFTDDEGGIAFLAATPEPKKSIMTQYAWARTKRAALAALTTTQQFAVARAQAERTLARLRAWNEGDHPRVPAGQPGGGQFTDDGGGTGTSGEKPAAAESGDVALDPTVIAVGGDEWNKATARRLEREYQTVKPKLDEIEQRAIGASVTKPSTGEEEDEDEDNPPAYVPEEWDMLSNDDQEEAKSEWISANKDSYYDSEVENWQSEYAHDEGIDKAVEDYNDASETDWARDAINEVFEETDEGEKPIPYSVEQLLDAIEIEHESGQGGSWPKKEPQFVFDDDKLQEPGDKPPPPDPNQMRLPGIEPPPPKDYSEHLTEDMREKLTAALKKALDKEADRLVDYGKIEPPSYLMESTEEYMDEAWDQMDNESKFSFVKNNTSILDKYEEDSSSSSSVGTPETQTLDRLPSKYDPLNETSGADYQRTQLLARFMSRERSKDILAERNLPVAADHILRSYDHKLWQAWKNSSTSQDGKLLQVATADELGGRLNAKTAEEIDAPGMRSYADRIYISIGGYKGVKALVRAKWETAQHLLDKAGEKELRLYRGLTLERELVNKLFGAKHADAGRTVGDIYKHMPTMDVLRNGAASTTTDVSVANNWQGRSAGKVVLRAIMPRTAAVSIPAFGINIKSEHEVVVAGTAWKGWDVWKERAPHFSDVPLQEAA